MTFLSSSAFTQGAGAACLGLVLLQRAYQKYPHGGRVVQRARRGWRRCRSCGREYHRSIGAR